MTDDTGRPSRPDRATPVAAIPPAIPANVAASADGAAGGPERERERERVLLHMPVDVRSASLVVIAFLLVVYALKWAAAVVIPVLMSLLFSYALSPVVDRLVRWHLPRAVAAALVMVVICGGLAGAAWSLSDQANSLVESLPTAATKLRDTIREKSRGAGPSPITQVQKAAATLEQAAAPDASAAPRNPPGITKVQVVKPAFDIHDYLFSGSLQLAEGGAQALGVAFITYFLLAAGDTFRRKMARIAGPSLGKRRITVQALDEISDQVQRYLLVQLLTSIVVGVATGLAFWWLKVDNPAAWGVVAGVLNLIPYVGTVIVMGASAVVALMQFGTLRMALAVAAVSIVLHIVSGYILTPWLTSRTSRLNAVVVFIGVIAWGWLWGVWGLLLGTPILMAMKAVCDRVDDLKPIGELMGGTEQDGEASGSAGVRPPA